MDEEIRRPWWRSRRIVAGAGAATAVLVAGAMGFAFLGKPERSLRVASGGVTIEPVRQGVFHDLTTLEGRVAPKDVIYLDALEGGQVEQVLVQAGDRVTAGQPLLVFRNTQLELNVLGEEGRLVESITQLQTFEKQLEQNRADNEKALANIDYNIVRLQRSVGRREPLAARGFTSAETLDQVRDELRYNQQLRPIQSVTNERQEALRQRQAPQIRAEIANLQKSLDITRKELADLTVRAPVAGRLTSMDLKLGQNRNRGDRLGEIAQDTGYKIAADIDEYYLGRVRTGLTAQVDVHGRPTALAITRIYPQVHGGTFTVDLTFNGASPSDLTPGEAVRGRLALGADRQGLVLPAGAFLEQSGGDWAFVVSRDGGHAERRRIKIGRRNSDQVEVLSGLEPGERVITSSYQGWERIDRIDLTNANQGA
jgi:HlyD family secretion protein